MHLKNEGGGGAIARLPLGCANGLNMCTDIEKYDLHVVDVKEVTKSSVSFQKTLFVIWITCLLKKHSLSGIHF